MKKSIACCLLMAFFCFNILMHGKNVQQHQSKSAQTTNKRIQNISFSHPYPPSPVQRMKALAMRLWGELEEVTQDPDFKEVFFTKQYDFVQRMLDLSTVCDQVMFFISCPAQVHQRNNHMVDDIKHVATIVYGAHEKYVELFSDDCTGYCFCSNLIFERVTKRLACLIEKYGVQN